MQKKEQETCDIGMYKILSDEDVEIHKMILKSLGYLYYPKVLLEDNVLVAKLEGFCGNICKHRYSIGNETFCANQEKIKSLLSKRP